MHWQIISECTDSSTKRGVCVLTKLNEEIIESDLAAHWSAGYQTSARIADRTMTPPPTLRMPAIRMANHSCLFNHQSTKFITQTTRVELKDIWPEDPPIPGCHVRLTRVSSRCVVFHHTRLSPLKPGCQGPCWGHSSSGVRRDTISGRRAVLITIRESLAHPGVSVIPNIRFRIFFLTRDGGLRGCGTQMD